MDGQPQAAVILGLPPQGFQDSGQFHLVVGGVGVAAGQLAADAGQVRVILGVAGQG